MNGLIDKVIFGGVYRVSSGQWDNDQSNRMCVPVVDEKGNLWMQDTYQIQRPSLKPEENTVTDAQIRKMIDYGDGEHSWCLNYARGNFYHKNQNMIVNEDELNKYELIADLRNYRGLKKGEDYRDYKDDDVVSGIKLFFEHGYSWAYGNIGAFVVRKDARKNNISLLKKHTQDLYYNMNRPYSSIFHADYVRESLKSVEDTAENFEINAKAKCALMLHEKLLEMKKEFEQFEADVEVELGLKREDS